jgi:16S rRNA (guanine966-N2)-methyltransferase
MSIVQSQLPGAAVVDLFAGSGALGLEALSRGAARADFVEQAPESLRALHANIEALDARERAQVHRGDALRFARRLEAGQYDVAFADPPYGHGSAAALAEIWLRVRFAGVLGVEHAHGEPMPPGGAVRRYGSTVITFYQADDDASAADTDEEEA